MTSDAAPRDHCKWDADEDGLLRQLGRRQMPIEQIGLQLGRTAGAVRKRLHTLEVDVPRHNHRRLPHLQMDGDVSAADAG